MTCEAEPDSLITPAGTTSFTSLYFKRAMVGWVLALVVCSQPGTAGDVEDLSLLPLDKLIAVKRALSHNIELTTESPGLTQVSGAQPLRGDPARLRPYQPPRRGGGPPIWIEEVEGPWKGGGGHGWSKGKGLQTIFLGTVTTLAFLAFGGYLLCLILQALKEKKAALTMTLLTTATPVTQKRRRRAQSPVLEARGDDMYQVLRGLAEGYARYEECRRVS